MESQSLARLRFAVGIFDTWENLRDGVRDLGARGLGLDSLNCLGLRRVFAGATIAPLQPLSRLLEQAIDDYLLRHNATAKPYVWTKPAAEILAKERRALDNSKPSRPGIKRQTRNTREWSTLRR
jgi:hypothetical protein